MGITQDILGCNLCADRFATTATGHTPKPVVWFHPNARILIAGQAPGARVHASGIPFDDPSGDRLRQWMGLGRDRFYDKNTIAILPMAFCFPGYDRNGSDLPPPKICAQTWRKRVLDGLQETRLVLLVGGYAQNWHLKGSTSVTQRVASWRDHAPLLFPLPHPSWRNTGWLKKNPWFETDMLPELRKRVEEVLND